MPGFDPEPDIEHVEEIRQAYRFVRRFAKLYRRLLKARGIECRMSRKGDC